MHERIDNFGPPLFTDDVLRELKESGIQLAEDIADEAAEPAIADLQEVAKSVVSDPNLLLQATAVVSSAYYESLRQLRERVDRDYEAWKNRCDTASKAALKKILKKYKPKKPVIPADLSSKVPYRWSFFVDWTPNCCFVTANCFFGSGCIHMTGPVAPFDGSVPSEEAIKEAVKGWNDYWDMVERAILQGQCECQ